MIFREFASRDKMIRARFLSTVVCAGLCVVLGLASAQEETPVPKAPAPDSVAVARKADMDATLDQAMEAYQISDFDSARKIVETRPDHPVARLILALCQTHDQTKLNYDAGLKTLSDIWMDDSQDTALRVQAGLSRARVIQVFQWRDMNREYSDVDVEGIFRKVMEMVPDQEGACTAVLYLAENYLFALDKEGNPDKSKVDQGFELLEGFIRDFKGKPKDLVPIHLYLDPFYIAMRADYASSVAHLKRALDAGVTNQTTARSTIFRVARISQVELKDIETAKKYYRMFQQNYQYAREKPLVDKYLKELEGQNAPQD